MSDVPRPSDAEPPFDAESATAPNHIEPLAGEPGIPDVASRPGTAWSGKGLLAVGSVTLGLVGIAALLIVQFTGAESDEEAPKAQLASTQPAAATAAPRRLEIPATPTVAASSRSPAGAEGSAGPVRVPALAPVSDGVVEPIGVRRTGSGAPAQGAPNGVAPEDAPVVLVSTRPGALTSPAQAPPGTGNPNARGMTAPHIAAGAGPRQTAADLDPNNPMSVTARNLEGYQTQLQGLLETLTRATGVAGGMPSGAPFAGSPSAGTVADAPGLTTPAGGSRSGGAGSGLFGGQLTSSQTTGTAASLLSNRSLTLPKGTAFTCALKTKVISATSGLVGCQVQRNVFSDDGRVLLVERGSHLDGEYRVSSVRPGMVRIPVLWTRIRTPHGVVVDIDSPGTGQLGESGIDGYVDNRWVERIGAAMLLSLIDDTVKLVIQNEASDRGGDTIVLPSTTSNTSKLAEKVLDSTINIPPLIYQNQGGIVGIYVARDVDFSSVYELRPTALDLPGAPREGAR